MFEFIRRNNKLMTGLMLLFVIPSFVASVEFYRRTNDAAQPSVARVGGEKITQEEWDAAHQREIAQIQQQNPDADTGMLDSPYAKYATLERLVEQKLITAAAQKYRLYVSDQRVAQTLMQIPEIAALRGTDGKIDQKKYDQLLRDNRRTPEEFEGFIRNQLSQQQVVQGVSASVGWQPTALSEMALKPLLEQREVQVALFKSADYASKVTPSDTDLQAWYKDHAAQYQAPEQASIEYLVLDQATIEKRHPTTEQQLKDWYAQNSARFGLPETRRASHILILADEKADAATLAAAKTKAEALLKEVQAKPETFAEVAKKNSQDPGSAAKGGDLGFFKRENMVKPFADAAFALKKGEISPVVQSKYGFHIIQLAEIKAGTTPPLEANKAKVLEQFQQEQLKLHFNNDAKLLAEEVAKDPMSLKAAAEKLGLPLQTAHGVTRTPVPTAQGALAAPPFLKALFSAESLDKKRNTDVVTVGPNQLVAGRVLSHTPARTLPYEEVKAQVLHAYVQAKASALAQAAGATQLKAWLADPSQAKFSEAVVISKMQPGQLPPEVATAALRAERSKLPALQGADLGLQGYAIVRVNKVLDADPQAAALLAQQAPMVTRALSQAQMQAYVESLKKSIDVKINAPKPEVPAALAGLNG